MLQTAISVMFIILIVVAQNTLCVLSLLKLPTLIFAPLAFYNTS